MPSKKVSWCSLPGLACWSPMFSTSGQTYSAPIRIKNSVSHLLLRPLLNRSLATYRPLQDASIYSPPLINRLKRRHESAPLPPAYIGDRMAMKNGSCLTWAAHLLSQTVSEFGLVGTARTHTAPCYHAGLQYMLPHCFRKTPQYRGRASRPHQRRAYVHRLPSHCLPGFLLRGRSTAGESTKPAGRCTSLTHQEAIDQSAHLSCTVSHSCG